MKNPRITPSWVDISHNNKFNDFDLFNSLEALFLNVESTMSVLADSLESTYEDKYHVTVASMIEKQMQEGMAIIHIWRKAKVKETKKVKEKEVQS